MFSNQHKALVQYELLCSHVGITDGKELRVWMCDGRPVTVQAS